jgi:hypothetical protein
LNKGAFRQLGWLANTAIANHLIVFVNPHEAIAGQRLSIIHQQRSGLGATAGGAEQLARHVRDVARVQRRREVQPFGLLLQGSRLALLLLMGRAETRGCEGQPGRLVEAVGSAGHCGSVEPNQ